MQIASCKTLKENRYMKKILYAITLTVLAMMLLGMTVTASSIDGFVSENGFTVASFNGTKTFIDNAKNPTAIEDASWWLINERDKLNLKYVSVLGQISGGSYYNYSNTVGKGMSVDELINLCREDKDWQKEFSALASAIAPLTDEGIPVGVSLDNFDYTGAGYNRQSLQAEFLGVERLMPRDTEYEYYDDSNYYTVVDNNGVKYIIFQLELWPQTAVLNWFNSTIAQHPDKRAIIFTTSFIDDNGAMYTMWDWENDTYPPLFGSTKLRAYSMTWVGKPRDGEAAWNYAFSKHDNILAIISSKLLASDKAVSSKIKNANGVEVVAIASNGDNGIYAAHGACPFLVSISEDNKTIKYGWAKPFGEMIESTVKTVTLDTLGELAQADTSSELPKIPAQFNGANTAYIFGKGNNKFEPNSNMTRVEACTVFARLILGKQTIPDGYSTRFTDVKKGDWFYNAIAFLDETGYFFRNENTSYKPNEPITRAEFVELAGLASMLVERKSDISFADVDSNHFYYSSIMAAASSGLVNGYEDNTFRPDNTITRAEVVTVINRLLGLNVSEKTVSEARLENVFDDIKTHWGRLNILMASNSGVHGEYYYNASLEGVEDGASEITFKNKHFSFSINKKNGKVTEFINLYTGENVNNGSQQFLYLNTDTGNKVLPTSVKLDGSRIKFSFKDGVSVYMIVEVKNNYMTFEIDSEVPDIYSSVTFANLNTTVVTSDEDNSFMLNSMGMTAWVNPVNKGFRAGAVSSIAHAYTKFDKGTFGSKMGVVFSKRGDAIKYLQELTDAIDTSVGLASRAGGAYAQEWEGNFGDYIICDSTKPEDVEKTIAIAKELGIDQIDIHQSGSSFRQGDMYFHNTETGTAKEFYEKVGKRYVDAGFELGLHTYAYYITYKSDPILSNPKWQRDLETLETYTLRKTLSKFRKTIPTEEDASGFNKTVSFFLKNSRYVLIDEEIILIGSGTEEGFINVTRGQCGTSPAEHPAGTTIYHLSGYFNMFTPKLGSELFYHIADLTAKAYNDGGFSMIYFDAIDGLSAHVEDANDQFYYFQMFIHRVISQCERTPIIETSSSAPQEWNVRGRTGAWDYPTRAIKQFIANHVSVNLGTQKTNLTSTLGWFNFQPDAEGVSGMKNTVSKTLFRDDIDFIGMNSLIHNMSMVYSASERLETNPFFADNVRYYRENYSKLRKSDYFTREALDKVKSEGGEWKVIKKGEGEYAFLQMYYSRANLSLLSGDGQLNGENPFNTQTPFIRIEARWSTLLENETLLVKFDEDKTLKEQTLSRTVKLNMVDKMAMKVRVKGTGADGDALLISLTGGVTSGESNGRGDHFIDLNFEGWKEFILLDIDNAEYDIKKYTFSGINTDYYNYITYRRVPNYEDIINVTVRCCGKTGDTASISSIYAYTQTPAPVKNPTVTVGGSSMVFNAELQGGDYIEYDPLTSKALLYHNAEERVEEITFSGALTIPTGDFKATYSAEALTDAPVRARLVFGFAGKEITN